ncbi:MAG: UDP-N-acetylmuramoyl-tripeptide--D-alanyl-D-alanine ligase [Candidatus Dormibacteraeota bacterium]|nr:UDP-N-acetylmuramoyl-tripeptide--D-alanyl-D-alanine ligase [Candidatus Dormibacteraeota bacterium]
MDLTLDEVAVATRGRVVNGAPGFRAHTYQTDSREVRADGLFFALRGAQQDGHSYVASAASTGAAAVVERTEVVPLGAPAVQVENTWQALFDLAAHVLQRTAPVVIGITGSNGKTSTREMVAAVLGDRYHVLQTAANLNTETGVPLTLLRLEPRHEVAVIEMGMQGSGEIARLARLARPRVGVITGIGTVHAEYFADGKDGVCRAKGELLQALPEDGLAVLNADDPYYQRLAELSPAPVVGFGFGRAQLRGEDYRPLPEGGSSLQVAGVQVRLGPSGRHQARNALAALAVGSFFGIGVEEAAGTLAGLEVEHRLQPRRAPAGFMIVDDAYNASPESMLAAFETLVERPRRGRLLAVLGEMRELGELAPAAHEEVGRRAAQVFDQVAVVDQGYGRLLAHSAGAELVNDQAAATAWVRAQAQADDLVLIKASHGVALDRVVEELLK